MDHAAAQDLQPVLAGADLELAALARAADVDLRRGLGEGKEGGPEAQRQITDPEIGTAEGRERALQVAHVGRAVDHQALDLMEHRRMGGVVVGAEGPARGDDPERWLMGLHVADLHRGGVGAQDLALAAFVLRQIEGVVLLARRVLGRDVEGGEVVKVVLDVGADSDAKAHLTEDGDDFLDGLADRMQAADGVGARGQRDVETLLAQAGLQRIVLERGPAGLDRRSERRLHLVQRAAHLLALVGRQRAQSFQALGDFTLLAERGDPQALELGQVGRLAHLPGEVALELLETIHRFTAASGPAAAGAPGVRATYLPPASAASACSASDLKVSGSRMARSERILRSSSMPARLMPFMNCE